MKELDLTKGSVPKVLMQFAMPYLLANVLQALYGGADLFVVGRFDDAASVAGVAIGSQVMQTVTGIILGLTAGITVLTGIATGARDEKKAAATIGSAVWLFAIIGAVLTLLMTVWHDTIATAMHTPPEAMTDTRHYLLICSLGISFIIGYNVVFGIMRGLGDSRSPLYFVALACIINIVLDFVLVGGCHMRAAGAATATIASQGISFAAALWYLHRKGFRFPFTRRDIRLNGILSKRIIKLGTPIALQDALINISFLIITVIREHEPGRPRSQEELDIHIGVLCRIYKRLIVPDKVSAPSADPEHNQKYSKQDSFPCPADLKLLLEEPENSHRNDQQSKQLICILKDFQMLLEPVLKNEKNDTE